MSKNVLLIAEVDEYLKGAAEAVFARNGMKTSTAINYYLHQVVFTQEIPALIVQPPNAMFDIREYDSQNSFSNPSLAKVRVVKKKDTPVICYDVENDREYLLDTDGQRYLDYARLKIDEYRYKTLIHLDGSGTIGAVIFIPSRFSVTPPVVLTSILSLVEVFPLAIVTVYSPAVPKVNTPLE